MLNMRVARMSATMFRKHKYVSNATVTPPDTVIAGANNLTIALTGNMPHFLQESTLAKLARPSKIFSDTVTVPEPLSTALRHIV